MFFFTADEHYGHKNIIKYCDRPFNNIEEMDNILVKNHNEIVTKKDITYHLGDFTLKEVHIAGKIIHQLNGKHFFLRGSHDYWLSTEKNIMEIIINKQNITLCHYAMRSWSKSFHGSWQLFGHSHGGLEPIGKQWDVGVDNNNFWPVSFDEIKDIMSGLDNNID